MQPCQCLCGKIHDQNLQTFLKAFYKSVKLYCFCFSLVFFFLKKKTIIFWTMLESLMWTVLNQLRKPDSLASRNMFLILEGFSENGQGKVEPCTLNSRLQKQKNKGWEKPGESAEEEGWRRQSPRALPCWGCTSGLQRGKGRSASGLALVKMSPVRFHCERRFYLPFPQPLSSGYVGLGPAAAAWPPRMAGP